MGIGGKDVSSIASALRFLADDAGVDFVESYIDPRDGVLGMDDSIEVNGDEVYLRTGVS